MRSRDDSAGDAAGGGPGARASTEPASAVSALRASPPIARHIPAEAFPPGVYLAEELEARGWTAADLASRMGGKTAAEIERDELCAELFIAVHSPKLVLDAKTARKFGKAFGTSAMLWLNIDAGYRWACAQGIEASGGDAAAAPSRSDESPVPEGQAP